MSRSSSNASSFASVVEEHDGEPEVGDDYDTGLVRTDGETERESRLGLVRPAGEKIHIWPTIWELNGCLAEVQNSLIYKTE
jgi:hypothetical protein